ncbi:2133_t:CDS:1, partial [Entrophospora sp. SA101]
MITWMDITIDCDENVGDENDKNDDDGTIRIEGGEEEGNITIF